MRLFTHNLLVCNVSACVATASRSADAPPLNFPLRIEAAPGGLRQEESAFNAEATLRLLRKLDWPALRAAAASLGVAELPPAPPARPEDDEAFLRSVHTLVMDVHVMEGRLVCPNCARAFPIASGIPNMLLTEAEA
jgi:multifunctional methyltransferase subunit TRM112